MNNYGTFCYNKHINNKVVCFILHKTDINLILTLHI